MNWLFRWISAEADLAPWERAPFSVDVEKGPRPATTRIIMSGWLVASRRDYRRPTASRAAWPTPSFVSTSFRRRCSHPCYAERRLRSATRSACGITSCRGSICSLLHA